jgi:hypothetical protein
VSLLAAALLAARLAQGAAGLEVALAPLPAQEQEQAQDDDHGHEDAQTTFEQDYASLVPS